eukprot:jgi/Mesen1/9696/ME000069S09103
MREMERAAALEKRAAQLQEQLLAETRKREGAQAARNLLVAELAKNKDRSEGLQGQVSAVDMRAQQDRRELARLRAEAMSSHTKLTAATKAVGTACSVLRSFETFLAAQ